MRARDGYEALDRVRESSPSLVVLDLMMPRLDGRGFIREAQRLGLRDQLKILVVTAASRAEEEMASLNAEGYLDKPFSLFDLLEQVERLAA